MDTESISQMIQGRARRFGSKLALCSHGGGSEEKYTYRALDEASDEMRVFGTYAPYQEPDSDEEPSDDSKPEEEEPNEKIRKK